MEEKKLEQAIDAAKVVSFDVFDTLLFRITARPEAIFSLMGQKIGREDFEQFRRIRFMHTLQKQIEHRTGNRSKN